MELLEVLLHLLRFGVVVRPVVVVPLEKAQREVQITQHPFHFLYYLGRHFWRWRRRWGNSRLYLDLVIGNAIEKFGGPAVQ